MIAFPLKFNLQKKRQYIGWCKEISEHGVDVVTSSIHFLQRMHCPRKLHRRIVIGNHTPRWSGVESSTQATTQLQSSEVPYWSMSVAIDCWTCLWRVALPPCAEMNGMWKWKDWLALFVRPQCRKNELRDGIWIFIPLDPYYRMLTMQVRELIKVDTRSNVLDTLSVEEDEMKKTYEASASCRSSKNKANSRVSEITAKTFSTRDWNRARNSRVFRGSWGGFRWMSNSARTSFNSGVPW